MALKLDAQEPTRRVNHRARADYLQLKCQEALGLLEQRRPGGAKQVLRMALARHQPLGARAG